MPDDHTLRHRALSFMRKTFCKKPSIDNLQEDAVQEAATAPSSQQSHPFSPSFWAKPDPPSSSSSAQNPKSSSSSAPTPCTTTKTCKNNNGNNGTESISTSESASRWLSSGRTSRSTKQTSTASTRSNGASLGNQHGNGNNDENGNENGNEGTVPPGQLPIGTYMGTPPGWWNASIGDANRGSRFVEHLDGMQTGQREEARARQDGEGSERE
ncbi:hypothetical protein EV356DRAFT_503924 [Viridothelium virens]|uniref:Uncharacterized protein n=1 Tax=Viridothelium virens TaxID=1048519 RepID=A0A6A6H5C0_VIRVR|nr:hypothetical protein EV356DRAFT_503924 [Viridothelium virens]